MEEERDDGEDCVEFVRAVSTQSLSTINIKPHSNDCDARQGISDELLSLFTKNLLFSLPYSLSTQVEAIMKGLKVFFWK